MVGSANGGGGVNSYYGWKIKSLLRSVCLSLSLKLSTFGESTKSAGSEFKIGTMRLKKKNFRVLVLASGTDSLRG